MENHNVAWFKRDAPFVVACFLKNAERKSSQLDFAAAPILIEQRLRLPGIGNTEFAAAFLPRRKARSHETAFDAPLADELIHLAQHFRRLQFLRSQTAHDANRHGTVERSGSSLSADIRKCHAELLRAGAEELEQIATDFTSREVTRGHIELEIFGGNRTDQRALNAFRSLQVAFEPRFVARNLFVKPRVFQ